MTDAEFWEMTPREFDAVWDQYIDAEERADRRIGLLYTMYYNAHLPKDTQPKTLDELFPSRNVGRASKIERVVTSGKALRDPMEQLAMARQFTKSYHNG